MPKTKYLRPGKQKPNIELKIGKGTIEETDKYTYLGEINNRRMDLSDQITNIEGKVEAAYQTLLAVAEDREFRQIKMQTIWTLVQTCIVPLITYASETWQPKKQERKKLNQILDKILRRILMTPDSTPREGVYMETGLLDIETISDSKRLNMKARLNRDKSELMSQVLSNPECKWEQETMTQMLKYSITAEELMNSRYQTKAIIKRATLMRFKTQIEESA